MLWSDRACSPRGKGWPRSPWVVLYRWCYVINFIYQHASTLIEPIRSWVENVVKVTGLVEKNQYSDLVERICLAADDEHYRALSNFVKNCDKASIDWTWRLKRLHGISWQHNDDDRVLVSLLSHLPMTFCTWVWRRIPVVDSRTESKL